MGAAIAKPISAALFAIRNVKAVFYSGCQNKIPFAAFL
jgi:hypothetical protein